MADKAKEMLKDESLLPLGGVHLDNLVVEEAQIIDIIVSAPKATPAALIVFAKIFVEKLGKAMCTDGKHTYAEYLGLGIVDKPCHNGTCKHGKENHATTA